jgi:hypothetical protein
LVQGSSGIVIFPTQYPAEVIKLIPVHSLPTSPWVFGRGVHRRIASTPIGNAEQEYAAQLSLWSKKLDVAEPLSSLFAFTISSGEWWAGFRMERLRELGDVAHRERALRQMPSLLCRLHLVGGYQHGDLHLNNVMQRADGTLCIVDFGKADMLQPRLSSDGARQRLYDFLPCIRGILCAMIEEHRRAELPASQATMAAYQEAVLGFMGSEECTQLVLAESTEDGATSSVLGYMAKTNFKGKQIGFLLRRVHCISVLKQEPESCHSPSPDYDDEQQPLFKYRAPPV